jgi:beta-N-acetylhexosaminidase
MQLQLPLSVICGQLLVCGFYGTVAPPSLTNAMKGGLRGGVILFRRNLTHDLEAVAELNRSLADACASDLPPLIGVDQEGGRVARLGPPVLTVPPMLVLARSGGLELAGRVARAQARELSALGFTMNFAPVLDVNTCEKNPIIGDRAFSSDAREVVRYGAAYVRGLQDGGVLACGKHFPGHGDTAKDSHLELPVVTHGRARLDECELLPFRAAIGAGVAALMSAHVEYPALDKGVPATMSRAICASLLRRELAFDGVLLSDDLEMKAIADRYSIEEAAVEAIWAGCDGLLVCSDEERQARAHEALVRRAETDARFRDRCAEAAARMIRIRRLVPPRPAKAGALAAVVGGPESAAVARELSARLPQ